MRLTKVGKLLIPGVTTLKEDVTYNYTAGGHTLLLAVSNPTREEIHAVQHDQVAFGLSQRDHALFIFVKFGKLPWQATYYNWWINAPVTRPNPCFDLDSLQRGLTVSVCLVNAANGILEALRAVTLSREYSRAFLEIVSTQTMPPFDPWAHADVVEEVLKGYASGTSMMRDVLCMCCADS